MWASSVYSGAHITAAHLLLSDLGHAACRTLEAFSTLPVRRHRRLSGGVINLADRCLLRRYKQPNNGVCSGRGGSRCAHQQVFTESEAEWNQRFAAERGERLAVLLIGARFHLAAQLRPTAGSCRHVPEQQERRDLSLGTRHSAGFNCRCSELPVATESIFILAFGLVHLLT